MNEFKEPIKNLRVRLEKSVEELKKFEEKGDVNAGEMAIWNVYGIWNGKEYGDLEKKFGDTNDIGHIGDIMNIEIRSVSTQDVKIAQRALETVGFMTVKEGDCVEAYWVELSVPEKFAHGECKVK